MTIEEMKKRKIELGYSNKTLAEKSGVPLGTLQKIFAGATQAPREETIKALEAALQPRGGIQALMSSDVRVTPPQMLHEPAVQYGKKRPGEFTLEDYLALPEDQRVELIDGVFYDMAAPTTGHQGIGGFIHKFLLDFVLENGGACMPFMAPTDVQLDCDDRTVVQPDVMVVCDRGKYRNGRVWGAPDLIIEVLSPSTRKKDMTLKQHKYANAGVREYWMIEPKSQQILVYDFEHEDFPKIYGFSDRIPVLIWDGRCEIDFSMIWEHVKFLYEQ